MIIDQTHQEQAGPVTFHFNLMVRTDEENKLPSQCVGVALTGLTIRPPAGQIINITRRDLVRRKQTLPGLDEFPSLLVRVLENHVAYCVQAGLITLAR